MVRELSLDELKELAGAGVSVNVNVDATIVFDDPVDPPGDDPIDPPGDPTLIYQQPGGKQSAPVYETFTKGNGKLEPSEKVIGRVAHNNQVFLAAFPSPMAATFVPSDWWYLYVVGPDITGWVRRKAGRSIDEIATN